VIILAVSTAEQGASLAVMDTDRLICHTYWDTRQTHSKRLNVMVEHMIEQRSGLTLDQIDAFVAARGPGSFTGLRIGISVIKGLAYATGKPALGVSSLDGIAYQFSFSTRPVCVMMDAKRNEVYAAMYQFKNGVLESKSPEQVGSPETVVAAINESVIFVGSGSRAYQTLVQQKAGSFLVPACQDAVSAVGLIQALQMNVNALDCSTYPLEPVYLRQSDAQMNRSGQK
jgi:tRNA threonylcarbamoyladenosine biosynthesis protein TsaB